MGKRPEFSMTEVAIDRKPPQSAVFAPEPLLDSEQAAAVVKIHPKTLQKFAREGKIEAVHIGKLWRFRRSALEAWIDRQTGT
jgi:excisionase family DNA binding protein